MHIRYLQNLQTSTLFAILLLVFSNVASGQTEPSDPDVIPFDNRTPTWSETIAAFERLSESSAYAEMIECGSSDVGRPLHAFVLSEQCTEKLTLEGLTNLRSDGRKRLGLLINNAIHPGEPCGVDASIAWLRGLVADTSALASVLSVMDIAVIPMYNVGGAMNRNCCTRTNQNGPEEYGFRGNARNLDLNRDFIKMDSRNAAAFSELFHAFRPNVLIDTHTTNGADYPYAMTLISTQPDKAGPVLGPFIREEIEPFLYASMEAKNQPMCPYVYSKGETPDEGIIGFLETPRYSTGYASLFGCIGFTAEAHMLKPFSQRVQATLDLIESVSAFMMDRSSDLHQVREEEFNRCQNASELAVRWTLDADRSIPLEFTGFEARREVSQVTGDIRLKYDQSKPWTRTIPFHNHYRVADVAEVPSFFVIPQAWSEVIQRLERNQVEMSRFSQDTTAFLKVMYVEGFRSTNLPYEGHHVNSLDSIRFATEPIQLYAGDYMISTDQPNIRYIMEVLDPRAHDSFFVWNFFDSAMQQKEHFSAYVFEETAAQMLSNSPVLQRDFESALQGDSALRANPKAQLNWLYKASKHFEGSVNRYPVYQSMR